MGYNAQYGGPPTFDAKCYGPPRSEIPDNVDRERRELADNADMPRRELPG